MSAASTRVVLLASAVGLGLVATPALAGENCADLSYQRNSIYKAAGYCFHTPEQIRNFGNAGCQFDSQNDVPLSTNQRREIAEIVRSEREMGCR